MARRKLLAGNWKMFKTIAEARAFAESLGRASQSLAQDVDFVICPPFTSLQLLSVVMPSAVKLGAQNVHQAAQGAHTGEISADMLAELGVHYVIVGHSERRHEFGESDTVVRAKVKRVAEHKMTPILCVGEDLRQRELAHTLRVVRRQTASALVELTTEQASQIVIAYEPIWAIGSGLTPSAAESEEVIAAIRECVADEKGRRAADAVRILYGGSVKPDNIASFVAQPNIDGALVGGASLDAESFAKMAMALGGIQ